MNEFMIGMLLRMDPAIPYRLSEDKTKLYFLVNIPGGDRMVELEGTFANCTPDDLLTFVKFHQNTVKVA